MKIVLDTNVFASVAVAKIRSNLSKIIELWSIDFFDVVTSEPIL